MSYIKAKRFYQAAFAGTFFFFFGTCVCVSSLDKEFASIFALHESHCTEATSSFPSIPRTLPKNKICSSPQLVHWPLSTKASLRTTLVRLSLRMYKMGRTTAQTARKPKGSGSSTNLEMLKPVKPFLFLEVRLKLRSR